VDTISRFENLKERDHPKYTGVDGRIILEWNLKEIGWEVVECVRLAQDRDPWRR
jgi:hypothetical protein